MSPRRKVKSRKPALPLVLLGALISIGIVVAIVGLWRARTPAPAPAAPARPKVEFPGPPGTEIALRGTDAFASASWWTRVRRAESGYEVVIGIDSGPRALGRRAEVRRALPPARAEELWTQLERLDCWQVQPPRMQPVPGGSLTELYLHRGDRERRLAYSGDEQNPVAKMVGLIEGIVGAPEVWKSAERDVEALQNVLSTQAEEDVRRCAQSGAPVGGPVRIRWSIDPKTSHARDITVSSGNADSPRVSCLREALATWTFPRPSVIADEPIEYNFNLDAATPR